MASAAGELLRTEGPSAVTHRRAADQAGIPQGSANHIFRTQVELYNAAVTHAEQARYESAVDFSQTLPRKLSNLGELARALIKAQYSPVRDEDLLRYRVEPMLLASMDPIAGPVIRRTQQRLRPVLESIVRRSELRDSSVIDLIPQLVVAAVLGASMDEEATDVMEAATKELVRILEVLRPGRRPESPAE